MPYKLEKRDNKWCVINSDTGENRGCSDSRKMGIEHLRASYAHEGKKEAEVDVLVIKALEEFKEEFPGEPEEDLEVKDMTMGDMMSAPYQPYYGATSFEEIDTIETNQEKSMEVNEVTNQYSALLQNIISSPVMDDKEKLSSIEALGSEYKTRLEGALAGTMDENKELDEKAVLSSGARTALPDSSFLYVEPGCKTQACRHFPVKHADGSVDIAHVRNAIGRIPQSNAPGLSAEKKKSLQARARKMLADSQKELQEKNFIEKAIDAVKNALSPVKEDENLLIYKEETGGYSWIARYSNNFRDNDNPPEIISETSHKRFVERVEKGLEPMPELWLWHIPEWKFGKATWVAYDDSGFAVAGGTIDKDKEAIAEWLSKQNHISVSHGMPPLSIKRDESDPSIIVEHATREISPLPDWAAANKLTGFIVLDDKQKQEDDMPIPANKRKTLIDQWHINPSLLDALEKTNSVDAEKALAEGVQSKEVSTEATKTVETPVTETPVKTETKEEVKTEVEKKQEDGKTSEVSQDKPITREEIAEAFTSIVAPFVDATNAALQTLTAKMEAYEGELKEIKEADDSKIVKKAMGTPAASLVAMFAAKSAIGQPSAKIDGRDSLAKSKPKEAQSDDNLAITGIPFVDAMLKPKQ